MAERLEKLADPAGRLQEIFANAPVGLQIYGRDGACVSVNGAHTSLFGAVPPPEDIAVAITGGVDLARPLLHRRRDRSALHARARP